MKRTAHSTAAITATLWLSSIALGQHFYGPILLGQGTEPAIAVTGADIVVCWHPNQLRYVVSTNYGTSFSSVQTLLPPSCSGLSNSLDPWAAASPRTRQIWLAAIGEGGPGVGPVYIAPKDPGQSSAGAPKAVTDCVPMQGTVWDKDAFTVGPRTFLQPQADDREAIYFAFVDRDGTQRGPMFSARSEDGTSWSSARRINSPLDPDRKGFGPVPLVIQNAAQAPDNFRGRLLVAYMQEFGGPTPWGVHVSYSDQEGAAMTWSHPPASLTRYGPGVGNFIHLAHGPVAQNAYTTPWSLGFALDPTHPNRVAVAFPGCVQPGGGATSNRDMFIAVSLDAGATFLPENTFRFTDDDLRIPGSDPALPTHEFFASLAFDSCGGVHLMYAQCAVVSSAAEKSPVSIGYARWWNWQGLSGPPATKHRFSEPFEFPAVGFQGNDYNMITARENMIHVAYADATGVNYRRVFSCYVIGTMRADMDEDGMLNTTDATLFSSLFAAGDPRADLAQDTVFDSTDVSLFMQCYTGGCLP